MNPLQLLHLDDDPAPAPTEPTPTAEPPPFVPDALASLPFEPERARTIWEDRLFDPVGGNIPLNEPVMLLRPDDPEAIALVELYSEKATDPAKAAEARATAARMRAWRVRHNAVMR